ncbi:MAG: FAD-binding oxidoreductase [Thermomicrobiales bacterium]|nr:FAD-binding oxidoreductase [Thermomicrobiales bacterium]
MSTVMRSVTGEMVLSRQVFGGLRQTLGDRLLFAGDDGYDESRMIWNGMYYDRRPAAIARCESAADVAAAVDFASDRQIPFSVRGAGHNVAGTALTDGGLMIDLTRMNAIHVDAPARRVKIGPGCDWSKVDVATEPFGLVVPGGIVSTTGVAGYTLGGGFGWLSRQSGFTSDLLLRATVVTADGQIREASLVSEPDLFWAIRGGGGNFGIVTEFEFRALELGPEIAGGLVLWPMERAAEVMDHFAELTATAPPELMHVLVLRVAPPAPFLPESVHGKPVAGIAGFYAGTADEGMAALAPVAQFGEPLANTIKPKPFKEHQAFLDSGQPYGRRYYWKSHYMSDFSLGVKDALLQTATTFTSPFSSVLLPNLRGIPEAPDGPVSAVGFRDASYIVNFQASWTDPAEDETHIAWARANFDAMKPNSMGQYVNFMTEDELADVQRRAYTDDVTDRLRIIKRQYDPDNIFRMNKNIEPA